MQQCPEIGDCIFTVLNCCSPPPPHRWVYLDGQRSDIPVRHSGAEWWWGGGGGGGGGSTCGPATLPLGYQHPRKAAWCECLSLEPDHVSRCVCVPLLAAVLCFMVGPLGLLCHLATKALVQAWRRGRGQAGEEVVTYRF